MISKQLILDTNAIAQFIIDEKMKGMVLSRHPENQKKYNENLKPKIDKLKEKYGQAPHQILNDFLKQYIVSKHLEKNITSDGKQFYTQVVNPYTWACIFNNDTSNLISAHSNSSQYPQLFLLIDNSEIRFGFCYGDHVKENDTKIQVIKQNDSILEKIFKALQNDKELTVYEQSSNNGFVNLTINKVADLKEKWSRDIQFLKRFSTDDVPTGIEEIITNTFNELLDLFTVSSMIDTNKDNGSKKYWQIAPGPSASSWPICVEKGIIPIFFNDILGKIPDDILSYTKEQLVEYCKKNSPQLREGQIGARVGSIWDFIHTVQIGDYILANKGQSLAVGWGIISTEAKICKDGSGISFYRHVDWKEPELNLKLDPELGKHFFTTILRLKKEQFDSVIFPTIDGKEQMQANPLFVKIQNILNYKKQVILYGPPGTGKTWTVSNFVDEKMRGKPEFKTRTIDKKFFWFSANPSLWDPTNLWKEGETEVSYSNIRSAFNDIEEGDIVFVYVSKDHHRIFGIATCSKKGYDKNDIPIVFIKGIKSVDGPKWMEMKEDPILSNAKPVRTGARGTLFPLDEYEGLRLLDRAKISPESIGLSFDEQRQKIDNCTFITFHPSYSYEEFIEGLRPEKDENGEIYYKVQEGIFKRVCRTAFNALLREAKIDDQWDDEKEVPHLTDEQIQSIRNIIDQVPVYFVIDEINRGDISRIFGELITLIEDDKRLFMGTKIPCTLPYSKLEFGIPPNLYIIGTMNTADRSISLMDIALRRRFGFCELLPEYGVLERVLLSDESLDPAVRENRKLAINVLKAINKRLLEKYDRDHQIGHSYLIKLSEQKTLDSTIVALENIWKFEILPLLQEYFFDSPEKLLYVLNNRFYSSNGTSFAEKPEDNFIAALQAVAQQKTGN